MSQIQIAENIQQEIAAIDQAQKEMAASKVKLRTFILSGESFLSNHTEFDRLLSEWSDTLMTLVEAVGRTFDLEGRMGLPQVNPLTGGGERISKLENSELTVTKAAVIIAGIVAGVVFCYLFPSLYVVGGAIIAVACIAPYFNQVINFIKGEKKSEKPVGLTALSGKINESISMIRNKHVKTVFRAKFKTLNAQQRRRYDPSIDKALYDYRSYALETLPRWCMSRIDDITVECNGVAFGRKMVLYNYWRSNGGNPQPQQNGQGMQN